MILWIKVSHNHKFISFSIQSVRQSCFANKSIDKYDKHWLCSWTANILYFCMFYHKHDQEELVAGTYCNLYFDTENHTHVHNQHLSWILSKMCYGNLTLSINWKYDEHKLSYIILTYVALLSYDLWKLYAIRNEVKRQSYNL